MKILRTLSLLALLLGFCATAQAQGYWQWMGTSFEGLPYHQRTDFGNLNYAPQSVDYDAWAEGNSVAFKENYVGTYFAVHHYTDERGRMNGESHNHKGEFASAHLALPYPPPMIQAGETLKWSLTITRNTSCGWAYSKPSVALGTVYFYAGNKPLASFDTNKQNGIRCEFPFSFKMGKGSPGQEIPFSFMTMFGGKKQVVVFHYKWVDPSSSNNSNGQKKKKWWQL